MACAEVATSNHLLLIEMPLSSLCRNSDFDNFFISKNKHRAIFFVCLLFCYKTSFLLGPNVQKPIIYAIIMDQVTRQHKLAVHHVESPESQLDQLQSSVTIYQDLCQIIVHNFSF